MLDIPDIANGIFELLGAPFILLSVFKLRKEKKVRGISGWHVLFFTSWGFWNLYYYPHLNQWMSFFGGIAIATINMLWLTQMLYYNYKETK